MIEKVLLIAFFSYGYCSTFWEGMIFEKIGDWLKERLPEYIQKPLFLCPICNAFWSGTAIYWIFWANDWKEWLLVCICAIGINAVIVNLINKIEAISENLLPPDE